MLSGSLPTCVQTGQDAFHPSRQTLLAHPRPTSSDTFLLHATSAPSGCLTARPVLYCKLQLQYICFAALGLFSVTAPIQAWKVAKLYISGSVLFSCLFFCRFFINVLYMREYSRSSMDKESTANVAPFQARFFSLNLRLIRGSEISYSSYSFTYVSIFHLFELCKPWIFSADRKGR